MGANLGTGEGAVSDLNLTPLIDIVLVVLIIMMVNMPIQIEEMGVKLPSTENTNTPPPQENVEQLVVAIYADDTVALNRLVMSEDRLFNEVSRRLRSMSKKNVFVDADATITYGRVVEMIDLAREAGAAKVGLAKMKDDGPKPPTGALRGSGLPRGITFGSPRVVGAITGKKADAAIQRHKAKFMACYSAALQADPSLTGRMFIRATVGPEGEHLEPPEIGSGTTIESETLHQCIEQVIPELSFEPLGEQETAAVQYQLMFSPG